MKLYIIMLIENQLKILHTYDPDYVQKNYSHRKIT